ncbi:phage tail sheath family protein [Limisalsivibrio acetivorans]|uniref:phage tail sheath family protein n=1 Tax=Limisalsivibrio acetivorans TaxID=1304888 RepID=UPI00192E47A5|nr:hypothetical protein [Limisalsivibrio acetivorans]
MTVDSAMPVVFGTAPVTLGNRDNVNKPVICYSFEEAVNELGYVDKFDAGYTLCEMMYAQFRLYNVAPVVFVNVLDPVSHTADVTGTDYTLAGGVATVEAYGIMLETVTVKSSDEVTTYVLDTDYSLSIDSDGYMLVTALDGAIADTDTVKIAYTKLDPSAVTSSDVVGGVDVSTGKKTGLELVDEVFPRFRIPPGLLLAPGYSQDLEVAVMLSAKAEGINGVFRATAIADLDDVSIEKYSDLPAYKQTNGLVDEDLVLCWPKLAVGGREMWYSTHLAGLIGYTTAQDDGVPYRSPSNQNLSITGAAHHGAEVILTPEEANYLNGQGIVTALNWTNGWVAWGNRTAAYPGITDPKDTFIPVRRMFSWNTNVITLTYWQHVDFPIRRRDIERIVDSEQVRLNGLTSREFILGGRILFRPEENPITDLMDGIIRFRLMLGIATPARDIEFILEYDPGYLETLFA